MFQSRVKSNTWAQMTNWLNKAKKIFVPEPNLCLCCHQPHSSVFHICEACANQIPWILEPECRVCGRHIPCNDCLRRRRHYLYCNRSAVRYDAVMKQWLARFKYRGDERLTPVLAEMLHYGYQHLLRDLHLTADLIDAITYVPLSMEREEERGFNQAERLARGLAEKVNIPVFSLVKRQRHSEKQSYLSRKDRMASLHNTFDINAEELKRLRQFAKKSSSRTNGERHTSGIALYNIIIVDDIYTTGNTLNQNARVILNHLPARCLGLTWARS